MFAFFLEQPFLGTSRLKSPDELAAMPFEGLIEEARGGCDLAAQIIVERYQPHVMQVIRRKMHRDMRQKFDSQDFAQAVWVSFFRNRDELLKASAPGQLIGYLAVMARNKLTDETRRRLNTKKHDIRREQQWLSEVNNHVVAGDTPSHLAMAHETFEKLMEGCSERDREIAILRMSGENMQAIAELIGVSERTVSRVLARMENENEA